MLNITLLANAGVLIETGETRILVDGLHCEGDYPFSRLPQKMIDALLYEAGPLRDIDYLAFTHAHSDHYTPALVLEYLRRNRVKRLLLPSDSGENAAPLEQYLCASGQPFWRMGMPLGDTRLYRLCDTLTVTAMGLPHMGAQFRGMVCDCLLVCIGGYRVLLMSDCSCPTGSAKLLPPGRKLDAALVNPYFLAEQGGARFLRDAAETVILYHIPFAGEDRLCLRTVVRQTLQSRPPQHPALYALTEAGQSITL